VKEGYEFRTFSTCIVARPLLVALVMQNYIAGDKISLFGFSRGAYTARALAGMLHKVCGCMRAFLLRPMVADWIASEGQQTASTVRLEDV
jgi:predicted esterase